MLSKKERVLTIEVLKMTLATEGGREFLLERFGKEGLKMAVGLLEEMGVHIIESAWRIAVESWLRSRGYIRPHIKTKVSPNFPFFYLMNRWPVQQDCPGPRSVSKS